METSKLANSRQIWYKSKKKKKAGQFCRKKRLFSKTFFESVLTKAREMPKNQKEKSWQDGLFNLLENIPTTITEAMT